MNEYDNRYEQEGYYWGVTPSHTCFEVLKRLPPDRHLKLLDIGCGEGRNAVFFARNGYDVTALDLSAKGVQKTKEMAKEASTQVNVFQANVNEYRLSETYDVLFSTGVLHYVPQELREELFENYKHFTSPGGLNVFSVLVNKPFIAPAPDADDAAQRVISGELFTYYHDWRIELCNEEIFDCTSGGTPHQHAVNRMVARKP